MFSIRFVFFLKYFFINSSLLETMNMNSYVFDEYRFPNS
jgi:hypothetical protein